MSDSIDSILQFARALAEGVVSNLHHRTLEEKVGSGFETEINSTFSALIARQASLALGLIESPQSWNPHIAPLFLRPMIECLIIVRWIRYDPAVRAKEYIQYGLGSEKLLASRYQTEFQSRAESEEEDWLRRVAELSMAWVEGQQFHQFVDVNLGSWAGRSVRRMCQEIESEGLYNFEYVPFSACVHNQWNHVGKFNAIQCKNPMHKRHFVGCVIEVDFVIDFVFRAMRYLEMTFEEFDEFYDLRVEASSPVKVFNQALDILPPMQGDGESSEGDN